MKAHITDALTVLAVVWLCLAAIPLTVCGAAVFAFCIIVEAIAHPLGRAT